MSNVSLVNGHIDYDELTPQKALEMLNDVEFSEKYQGKQEYTDMLLFCKEALEKRIPKKVTHEATLYRCCTCPTCKNVIDEFTEFAGKRVRVTVQHCKFCGQKIDWSDTE